MLCCVVSLSLFFPERLEYLEFGVFCGLTTLSFSLTKLVYQVETFAFFCCTSICMGELNTAGDNLYSKKNELHLNKRNILTKGTRTTSGKTSSSID